MIGEGVTVGDLWKKDRNRIEFLEKFGYNVLILWENDINDETHTYKDIINDWYKTFNN